MRASWVRSARSRLVMRIYLVGIVQFALVALGLYALTRQTRPPSFFRDHHVFVADTVGAKVDDPVALEKEVSRVERTIHWKIAVYDDTGKLVAGTPRNEADRDRRLPPDVALHRVDGRTFRLESTPPPPPGTRGLGSTIAIVLVVVGVASFVVGRSLSEPLERLSATTRAFGAGDLGARVHLARNDELGAVADAFDEMADRVEKALKAERELLANVSHELRTPLQRIHIAIDLASEGNADTARESLGEIAEDLAELERIVDDVLVSARLALRDGTSPASVPPARPVPTSMRELIEKSAGRFRSAHPERPLSLEVEDDLPVLSLDPVLVRRVIDNLLENAARYSDRPGTEVVIRARAHGREGLVVEVVDSGVGIAEDDLERVFEPFFRADRSRTRATGGLGLGLALSRRIVESHGGRLTLESELGKGTCARIELGSAASS